MKEVITWILLLGCLAYPASAGTAPISITVQASKLPSKVSLPVQGQIARILGESRSLMEKEDYRKAVESALTALSLVPEPQEEHKEMVEILATIGEANFRAKDFEQARNAFSDAMHFPGAIGDPWLHLRLGECQLELGSHPRARDELARAAMGGGKEIFAREDPKYWKYISSILKPPPGGW